MSGHWQQVRSHVWRDEAGRPVLEHVKKITPDGTVIFPWRHRFDFNNGTKPRWYKGKGADVGVVAPPLYRLDEFTKADQSAHVYIAEGEKDADALAAAGVLAVTAGGVSEFSPNHARLFRVWRGPVTIVRDNDAPGAWGAVRTHAALRAVGIPASRLRIVRGRLKSEGSDAFDHLAAGYTIDQFVSEPIAKIRRIAATATADDFRRAGYDRPPRYLGDSGWHAPATAEEAAQLSAWKPVRA